MSQNASYEAGQEVTQEAIQEAIQEEIQEATQSPNPIPSHISTVSSEQLPIHVNASGVALGVIATIAFVYALHWAQQFLIPLTIGIFAAYTLNPLVIWLERIKVPRAIGTSIVCIMIIVGTTFVGFTLQGEATSIIEKLPKAAQKFSRILNSNKSGQLSSMQQMQVAATEIERATSSDSSISRSSKKVAAPVPAGINVVDFVWASSKGVMGFIGQTTMVIFLVFFLLLSGDTFKRKLVKLTGPSLRQKKITVHILDEINSSIQSYMFMLFVTNTLLAILMWIALRAIGLENAGAWAVAAGLLHVIPYFGSLLITLTVGVSAFLQFETFQMAMFVAGMSLGIATLVGTFVMTWMTGRIAKMNAAAVFISLLFWGWIWGFWGLLLGVPMIVIFKVVTERLDGMEFIAELLAE